MWTQTGPYCERAPRDILRLIRVAHQDADLHHMLMQLPASPMQGTT